MNIGNVCDLETKGTKRQETGRGSADGKKTYTHNPCIRAERQAQRIADAKDKDIGKTLEKPHRKALSLLKQKNRPAYQKIILNAIVADGDARTEEQNETLAKSIEDTVAFTSNFRVKKKRMLSKKKYKKFRKAESTLDVNSLHHFRDWNLNSVCMGSL